MNIHVDSRALDRVIHIRCSLQSDPFSVILISFNHAPSAIIALNQFSADNLQNILLTTICANYYVQNASGFLICENIGNESCCGIPT